MSDVRDKPDFSKGATEKQADHIYFAAKGAIQALQQMEALTRAIMKANESKKHSDTYQLASLANHHCMDQANACDCMIEEVEFREVK